MMLIKENHEPCTKIEDGERFFNFYPPQVPEDDEDIDDDDGDVEELESQMDEDYEIRLTIRDQLVRHAVNLWLTWFNSWFMAFLLENVWI
jgi:hypothetical protein